MNKSLVLNLYLFCCLVLPLERYELQVEVNPFDRSGAYTKNSSSCSKGKSGKLDENSSVCSFSSAGDELSKRKTPGPRVSITKSTQKCDGVEALNNIQNYVRICEQEAARVNAQQALATEQQEGKEPKTVDSEIKERVADLRRDESRSAIKRKPKIIRVNPFHANPSRADHPLIPIPRAARTVEIRGGDVLGTCECLKRNGMQHDCPKWDCRGDHLCLTWPEPKCQPSGLGVPPVIESKIKKPEPAMCDMTSSEKLLLEKAKAQEMRKEEAKLVEAARANWQGGKNQAALQKAANAKQGYLKCKIHSGMYRLIPLVRNKTTQTVDSEKLNELDDQKSVCPCDDSPTKPNRQEDKKEGTGRQEVTTNNVNQETGNFAKTEPNDYKSVKTSTTGIPSAKVLKAQLKQNKK